MGRRGKGSAVAQAGGPIPSLSLSLVTVLEPPGSYQFSPPLSAHMELLLRPRVIVTPPAQLCSQPQPGRVRRGEGSMAA